MKVGFLGANCRQVVETVNYISGGTHLEKLFWCVFLNFRTLSDPEQKNFRILDGKFLPELSKFLLHCQTNILRRGIFCKVYILIYFCSVLWALFFLCFGQNFQSGCRNGNLHVRKSIPSKLFLNKNLKKAIRRTNSNFWPKKVAIRQRCQNRFQHYQRNN